MTSAGAVAVQPGDELRHPPGFAPSWREVWRFDAVTGDVALGVSVRLALHPGRNEGSYRVLLFGDGRPLVALVDDEVPLPRRALGLEIRSSGLWADHVCEDLLERWAVAVEAFALAVDPATEVTADLRGERVPLGLDLEWEADRAPDVFAPGHYEVPARVRGEVVVGREQVGLDGWGRWTHRWGPAPTAPGAWSELRVRGPGGVWVSQAVPDAARPSGRGRLSLQVGTQRLRAGPVAWAALRLARPGGSVLRWRRGLLRLEAAGGPVGAGWIDLGALVR